MQGADDTKPRSSDSKLEAGTNGEGGSSLNAKGGDGLSTDTNTTSISDDGAMPIAVVGIACRFPGEATNPDKLWELISKGGNAHGTWPADRFNVDAFYHPNPEHYGTFNTKAGHFMKGDVTGFDAPFFSITAKEAHAMDPQQRIALELTYEGKGRGDRGAGSSFLSLMF